MPSLDLQHFFDDYCARSRNRVPLNLALTMKIWLLLFLSIVLSRDLSAQKLLQISWATKHAAESPQLSAEQQQFMPLVQFGLATLPESSLMTMSGLGANLLGLSEANAQQLQTLLVDLLQENRK